MKEPIGLVLSGGGGKGAYQIGVWKYLEENKEKWNIEAVSGTSVGALNAALFSCLNCQEAENIWKSINKEDILTANNRKEWNAPTLIADVVSSFSKSMLPHVLIISTIKNYYLEENAFFSRRGIKRIIKENRIHQKMMLAKILCYASCYNLTKRNLESFCLNIQDPEEIEDILLSTTAIPFIFPNESINKEKDGNIERELLRNIPFFRNKIEEAMNIDRYCDGGIPFVGDNIPITPLYNMGYRKILVVHLKEKRENINDDKKEDMKRFPNAKIINLFPSTDSIEIIKSGIKGMLDFENNENKIQAGYTDAKMVLSNISEDFFI